MEVHAHSHTARRKWTHYFWEFLMLFLAVFCGFLAENQREHIIEHKREKKLMRSLVEELKLDKSNLESIKLGFQNTFAWLDSAFILFNEPRLEGKEHLLAEAIFKGSFWPSITFTDITLSQLRNAGYFRLIRNDSLANAIASYDTRLKRQNESQAPITLNSQLLDEELVTLFDHKLVGLIFQQQMSTETSDSIDLSLFKQIKMVSYDPSVLEPYKIKLKKIWIDYKMLESEYKRNYIQLSELLKDIIEEYHLE